MQGQVLGQASGRLCAQAVRWFTANLFQATDAQSVDPDKMRG